MGEWAVYTRRKKSNGSQLGEELPQISTTHVADPGYNAEWNMVAPQDAGVIPGTEGDWLIEMKFIKR